MKRGPAPRPTQRGGLALTELLLALPVFFFVILALARLAQSQGILAPAHGTARYAAWSQAALAAASPSRPPVGVTVEDALRAGHAPGGAKGAVEAYLDPEGESAARRIASQHAAVFAADLAQAGRVVAAARVWEDVGNAARIFPPASSSARVVIPVGCGKAARTGWMHALGEGPYRFWSRAYGGME